MSARAPQPPSLGVGGARDPRRGRAALRWAILALALWLLNFSVTFHNVWPTPWITTHHELSVEIALMLLALAVWSELRGPPPGRVLTVLAVVLLLMSLGRYAEVTAPALYGRRINLYWDGRYLPNVAEMMIRVVSPWLIAAGAVALAGLLVGVFALLRFSLGRVAAALALPAERRAVGAAAAVLVALFALGDIGLLPTLRWYSLPVTRTYTQQFQFIADALAEQHGGSDLPPPAEFGSGPFPRLAGADVLLIFMESYGATTYDNPVMRRELAPARADLARAVAETGRYAASAFVESPTFGGGSWLAHSSLMTGRRIADNGLYSLLLTQHRDTLARRFERQGYRAIAVMPGLKNAWPEGSFYGFDRIYGEHDLAYRGPQFGWWQVPDQYTLAKLDRMELGPAPRRPLFLFYPTVSTHIPFRPTAPYQPDWSRMLGADPYAADAVTASLAKGPEWTNLAPGYVDAVKYTFEYWAGYLRLKSDASFVVILIGDHQPASSVSGEGARWDVPVHVISKRRDIIETLEQDGFEAGLEPHGKSIGQMHSLTRMLLDDFSAPATDVSKPKSASPPASTDSGGGGRPSNRVAASRKP